MRFGCDLGAERVERRGRYARDRNVGTGRVGKVWRGEMCTYMRGNDRKAIEVKVVNAALQYDAAN